MNFALLWKMRSAATSLRHDLQELVKTPYLAFPGMKPFEIAGYLTEADSQVCYILSLWQTRGDLIRASALLRPGSFFPKSSALSLISQSQFHLTWEYCILPRTVGTSYLCVMKAPADLHTSRFEEMKTGHRNYIKQMSGLNRVWVGQSLDAPGFTTLFRADWNTLQARNQFLSITAAAQQKREAYQNEGFEVEYATYHLFDAIPAEEKVTSMPLGWKP